MAKKFDIPGIGSTPAKAVQGRGIAAGTALLAKDKRPRPHVLTTVGSFHEQILTRLKLMGAKVTVATSLREAQTAMDAGANRLLLPGGADVHPAYYNAALGEWTNPASPERDDLEYNLADWALRLKVPSLCICRGHQMMAVAAGGTLFQDMEEELGLRHNAYHTVTMRPTSALRHLVRTETPLLRVNSYHHQAVDRLPRGWHVTAWSPDQVVEGIARPGYPIVTTQFHPEAMTTPEAFRIFEGWLSTQWVRKGGE